MLYIRHSISVPGIQVLKARPQTTECIFHMSAPATHTVKATKHTVLKSAEERKWVSLLYHYISWLTGHEIFPKQGLMYMWDLKAAKGSGGGEC